MINPKELRIGNYVQDSEGVLGVIRLVASDLVYVNHFDGYAIIDPIFGSELNPIPLSEEWLIMFGFISYGHIYAKEFSNALSINYNSSLKIWFVSIHSTTTAEININHVHQLQNLYFALTGDELTIASVGQPQ